MVIRSNTWTSLLERQRVAVAAAPKPQSPAGANRAERRTQVEAEFFGLCGATQSTSAAILLAVL